MQQSIPDKQQRRLVRAWMQVNVADYTSLNDAVIAASNEFEHDEWAKDSTHWIWEEALEALERT